jgi:hypothetical protein
MSSWHMAPHLRARTASSGHGGPSPAPPPASRERCPHLYLRVSRSRRLLRVRGPSPAPSPPASRGRVGQGRRGGRRDGHRKPARARCLGGNREHIFSLPLSSNAKCVCFESPLLERELEMHGGTEEAKMHLHIVIGLNLRNWRNEVYYL